MTSVVKKFGHFASNLVVVNIRPWALLLIGLCLSSLARAQTVSATEKDAPRFASGNPAEGIEDVALSLAIVLLLIFILAWLVKRFVPGAGRISTSHMKVLSTLPLGGKERLMLVDVAGTQMVLGVSVAGIQCLHVFPEPIVLSAVNTHGAEMSFAKLLQNFKANREKT